MASVGIMVAGAVLNATAFIGGSQLAKMFDPTSKNLVEERKRHDLAIEKYTSDHNAWSEKRSEMYDFIQVQRLKQNITQTDFNVTDDNLQLYKEYHDSQQEEPQFSSYYQPTEEMKKYQYLYIIGGMGLSVYIIKKYIK